MTRGCFPRYPPGGIIGETKALTILQFHRRNLRRTPRSAALPSRQGNRSPPSSASSGSLFGRRSEFGARIDLKLFAIHVIPRERRGLDALEKLNLKYGESVISKRCLESGQVVFPHPDESLRAAEPRVQL